MMEYVRYGTVLGPLMIRVSIHVPDGRQYGDSKSFATEGEAMEWALSVRKEVLTRLGPEAERLGWTGPWEMQIHF